MKAGLVGYSQSGKTTLFNALTGLDAQTGAGRKGRTNLGTIPVPDERVSRLSGIFRPRKTTFAEICFVDVPGPDAKGRGLDSATIGALREVDALALVLRGFSGVDGAEPDSLRELLDFEAELLLADLQVVERRLERLRRERANGPETAVLERCQQALDAECALRLVELSPDELRLLSTYALLSLRPALMVLNVSEADVGQAVPEALSEACAERGIETLVVCAQLEAEIARLPEAERAEFLSSLGVGEAAVARVIRSAYALLHYESFFTVGEDEVRAWTIRQGDLAPRAAGRVHSDIERGFIRAEVMAYDEFIQAGSEAAMRQSGRLRVEGKSYVVRDGDIINFRFNV
jgi:GTP-binding protein YchF